MEDILQFLVIAGILAFGIFRQFNKEKAKKQEEKNAMPAPEYEYEYEPEIEEKPLFEEPQKTVMAHPKPFLSEEGTRSTHIPVRNTQTGKKAEASKNNFSIHSAEEARRAIIWSEILRRKY